VRWIVWGAEVNEIVQLWVAHIGHVHLGEYLGEAIILLSIEDSIVIEAIEDRVIGFDIRLKLRAGGLVE
jgi:hypothetical protein